MKVLRFIGIDKNILDYCSKQEQWMFKVFNIMQILLISVVGFSTYYLFDIIFANLYVSILLALFWSFVFYNLYRFILMTTSGKQGQAIKEQINILATNLFKIFVVAFFAIFISLPLELFISRNYIAAKLPEVLDSKIELIKSEIDSIYKTEYQEIDAKIGSMQKELDDLDTLINKLENKMQVSEIKEEQRQIFIFLNKTQAERILKQQKYTPVINTLKTEQDAIENDKMEDLNQYIRIIKGSNLLLDRFTILFENRAVSGFFIAALIVLIFLLPLLYKLYSIYKLGFQYEKVIEDRNRHEILYHYHLFKDRYKKITKDVVGEELEFIERFQDAPFNTLKKSELIVKETKGSFSADLVNAYNSKK